jgi:two-component system response regulator HydG
MKNFLVLVIDDSKVVCSLIQFMIESRLGVDCVYETNPSNISDELLEKVDLIVLDYYFGSIAQSAQENGLKYMRKLKKNNPSIPVIAFSGQKNISLALDMVAIGAVDYVEKNGEDFIDNLLESVNKIIEFKRSGFRIKSLSDKLKNNRGQFFIVLIIGIMLLSASFYF